jgi:hypothetical protein
MAFTAERTGKASLLLRDGDEIVCAIRDLHLADARFRPGGRLLIGSTVPLPLYWEQYADHENPERNAGNHASLEIVRTTPDEIEIACSGATFSRAMSSLFRLIVARRGAPVRYDYTISAALRIADRATWRVTPNPSQGELEFCNLWPEGIFSPVAGVPLRYQGTYIQRGGKTYRIPHHHLETPEKENIPLLPGDRVAWLLEQENLLLTLLSGGAVTAAVCAYMWDLHLAYRVCHQGTAVDLPSSTGRAAEYRLSLLLPEEAAPLVEGRVEESDPTGEIPLLTRGLSLYGELGPPGSIPPADLWPWEREISAGDPSSVRFSVERSGAPPRGGPALCIDASPGVSAAWRGSALGPAYRQSPFPDGASYRLTARVRSGGSTPRLSIRLHRQGRPGLFDPRQYEVFRSDPDAVAAGSLPPPGRSGAEEWTELTVETPPISPAPDRIHLLLENTGAGSCRFADIHYDILP